MNKRGVANRRVKLAGIVVGALFLSALQGASQSIDGTLGLLFIVALGIAIKSWYQGYSLVHSDMDDIDAMSGREFEAYLCALLRERGWKVNTTKPTGDFGADLKGKDPHGKRVVVQAKRWSGAVGISAIQEVIGARYVYRADRTLLITNNFLTPAARMLARSAQVEVWERPQLDRVRQHKLPFRKFTLRT